MALWYCPKALTQTMNHCQSSMSHQEPMTKEAGEWDESIKTKKLQIVNIYWMLKATEI